MALKCKHFTIFLLCESQWQYKHRVHIIKYKSIYRSNLNMNEMDAGRMEDWEADYRIVHACSSFRDVPVCVYNQNERTREPFHTMHCSGGDT